ncbi:MAG: rod shape-determining protein MreD [Cyclobacteriaceae bacterium]
MGIAKYIIRFILLVLLQVVVFKELVLFNTAMCFIYIAFLITIPLNIGRGYTLLLGFFLGITIDMFYNTGGVHAFACVFVAYMRPFILFKVAGEEVLEKGVIIPMDTLNWRDTVLYSLLMISLHHVVLLFTASFSFNLFFFTLLKIIVSTVFTSFIFLSSYYILKQSVKR